MLKKPVAWMKIYAPSGNYVASCNDVAAAAALMSFYGDGAEIRNGHAKRNIVWKEGAESQRAGESYDYVAVLVHDRVTAAEPVFDATQAQRVESGLQQARDTARRMMTRKTK